MVIWNGGFGKEKVACFSAYRREREIVFDGKARVNGVGAGAMVIWNLRKTLNVFDSHDSFFDGIDLRGHAFCSFCYVGPHPLYASACRCVGDSLDRHDDGVCAYVVPSP